MGRHSKQEDVAQRLSSAREEQTGTRASRSDSTRDPMRDSTRDSSRERAEARGQSESTDQTNFVDRIAQLVNEQVSQRAGKPANDLSKLAKALRLTSEQLEGNLTSPFIGKAADQLDRAVELLGRDGREVMDSVERFARTSPLAFVGGAIAVGIGAGRFLRSSAQATAPRDALESTTARASRPRNSTFQSQGNEP